MPISPYQRPLLKRIGAALVIIGFIVPLVIHFGREAILGWLSGGSTVPNQNAMLTVFLAYIIGIPGGIGMIIVGGIIFSRGQHPPAGAGLTFGRRRWVKADQRDEYQPTKTTPLRTRSFSRTRRTPRL